MGAFWGVSHCVVKSMNIEQNVAIVCSKYPDAFSNNDQETTTIVPDFILDSGLEYVLVDNESDALLKLKDNLLQSTSSAYRDAHFGLSESELETEELKFKLKKAKLNRDHAEVDRLKQCLEINKESIKHFKQEKTSVMRHRRKSLSVSCENEVKHYFQ